MTKQTSSDAIHATVRARYGEAARGVLTLQHTSCCAPSSGSGCCGGETASVFGAINYGVDDIDGLPEEAVLASLGCGNPIALARLEPGQTVLDLGSGGGIDVLLSADRVGQDGFVYGLDMTDEMLELAERNRQAAGVTNVRFLKGQIEAIPLPDASVDVIISNCVINLAADKPAVFREAYRVLRPGGKLAVSDVVIQGELAPEIRADLDAWAGCVAGALEEQVYLDELRAAGFTDAAIEIAQVYERDAALSCCGATTANGASESRVVSGFIRAVKPADSEASFA